MNHFGRSAVCPHMRALTITRRAVVALTIGIALTAAACGNDDNKTTTSNSTVPKKAVTTTTADTSGIYGSPTTTSGAPKSSASATTVSVAQSAKLGQILVDGEGRTLYAFD